MRIAFAVFKFDPLGGKERDALTLARMFRSRGHHLTMITSDPGNIGDRVDAVLEVPRRGFSNHKRMLNFSGDVERLRARHTFDAVIGFEKIGGLDYYYGEGLCTRSMTGPLARLTPRKRTQLRLETKVFGTDSETFAFFLSQRQMEQYREAYALLGGRGELLPTTLHPDRTKPDEYYAGREAARRELGLPDDASLLVNVAIFARQKGVDRIIDALAAVPDAHLLSIGLKNSEAVRQRAKARGVAPRTHFLAYSDDIPRLIGAADLMVHPARVENTGSVIVESLLFGVPVISTENCGYSEHIARSGAGTVVPEDVSIDGLARAIRQALDPENLADLRKKARDYADYLEENAGFDRIAGVMLDTIEKRATTPADGSR